ncbi:MAG: hypothetical protein JWR67_3663 [Mucilaginibacter sp.]|nr:hypothetical protein [Mucilaginibacter sp.]
MHMEKKTNKPRLVFFQWNHSDLPKFLQLHMQLHVKCLSEFFDVILINRDCDYQQICDIYQPDITLFESGYRTSISKKITIKNTSAYPKIPKLGLHNGDPWCDCRVGFISDMAHWGIETFFSICTTTVEHTPELAENLFVWPNFIDSDTYRDYGQDKIVPVLFNGYINLLYPWRQKVYNIVSNCYPSLIFPHLGYENHSPIMIHGEQYARTINASWFVPACGTLAKEVVRKHFEIPGSKSCLITEKTPSLEAAGFVDMQNCVFADEKDVLDKLNYLFQNTYELEKIINSGYQLVHSQHTLKQRDQIFQWFNLNKDIKFNQKIVQSGPFGPLKVVDKFSGIKSTHIICNGLNLVLMRQGDEKLWAGKYDEAEALYLKCLNYIHWMCEPKLKLAICSLYKGNADKALNWIIGPIHNTLGAYGALDPDPVEWAYFIISLFCKGNLNAATIRASQFPSLCHPELDRTRWVINYVQNKGDKIPISDSQLSKPRYSVHQLPQLSFVDWINDLCIMLKTCQQISYAEILSKLVSLKEGPSEKPKKTSGDVIRSLKKHLLFARINRLKKLNHVFEVLHIPNRRSGLPSISEIDHIIRLGRWTKIDTMIKYLSHLKNNLNIHNSSASDKINNDGFFQTVQCLLQKEDIKTVTIIGTAIITIGTEAIFTNTHTVHNERTVFCINNLNRQFVQLQHKYAGHNSLKFYSFIFGSIESSLLELDKCIKKVKKENEINFFDLILIDCSEFKVGINWDQLKGAKFIVLNNINTLQNYKIKQKLISDPNYTVIAQYPLHNNGYAIFKKLKVEREVRLEWEAFNQ